MTELHMDEFKAKISPVKVYGLLRCMLVFTEAKYVKFAAPKLQRGAKSD